MNSSAAEMAMHHKIDVPNRIISLVIVRLCDEAVLRSGWRLQARRVGPVVQMDSGVSLLCLLEYCLSFGARRQSLGLSTNSSGPCFEPILERQLVLEATAVLNHNHRGLSPCSCGQERNRRSRHRKKCHSPSELGRSHISFLLGNHLESTQVE